MNLSYLRHFPIIFEIFGHLNKKSLEAIAQRPERFVIYSEIYREFIVKFIN